MEKNRPTVYQANPLIEGRKPMNALEMRLFLLALQNVNPHISENDKYYDRGFKELHLTPSKVKEIFGHGEYLHRLKEVCRKLIQRSVVVEENGSRFTMRCSAGFAISRAMGCGSSSMTICGL